jgi:hypothetical protein
MFDDNAIRGGAARGFLIRNLNAALGIATCGQA